MMDKFLPIGAAISTQQRQQQQNSQVVKSSKSATVSEELRQHLKVFIQTYRNLPVLWDASLKDYNIRDKRIEAYEQLLPIYRLLKRNATLEDVKKKINTLRTNYRKELKVVEAARKRGNDYLPRWSFYELDFLRNSEKFLAINASKKKNKNTSIPPLNIAPDRLNNAEHFLDNKPDDGYIMNKDNTSPINMAEMIQKSFGHQNNSCNMIRVQEETSNQNIPALVLPGNIQSNIGSSVNTTQHEASVSSLNANKRLKSTAFPAQNSTLPPEEILNIACDFLSSTYPEEESIARIWTYKLKRLSRNQRLLAEKFINDILFEAELGTLYRGSMQLNSMEPYVQFEHSQNGDSSLEMPQSPNAISTTTNNIIPIESFDNNSNEEKCHSPVEVKNMLLIDGSTPSTSNKNDKRNTSAFSTYN